MFDDRYKFFVRVNVYFKSYFKLEKIYIKIWTEIVVIIKLKISNLGWHKPSTNAFDWSTIILWSIIDDNLEEVIILGVGNVCDYVSTKW